MSSFRDKFKSKIKSKQDQPETMESFDENALNVTLTQAKTQLVELKVTCQWVNKTTPIPPPKLHCKWYNRTEHNIQEIIGIEGEIYQPSVIDVGSIIEITCIPELPGVPYQGMPIMLKTNPICLSAETEAEATELLNFGRAKFFIDIKEGKLKHRYVPNNSEGLIKIEGSKITICHIKFGQLSDEVIKESMFDENYPQFLTGRKNSKELTLKLNEEEHLVIFFKGHEARDTFSLLVKLIMMRLSMDKLKQPSKQLEEEREVNVSSPVEQKIEEISEQKQKSSTSLDIPIKEQNILEKDEIKHSPPPSKEVIPIQQSPTKQSTADLLQLMNLRQEMKRVEIQNIKIAKQLQNEKEKVYSLECKIAESKQRLENVSRNYFSLQGQLNLAKQQKISLLKKIEDLKKGQKNRQEETLYYKNEINILTDERNQLKSLLQEREAKQLLITQELKKYQKQYSAKQNGRNYQELQQDLANALEISNELRMKYEYSMEEKDLIEEALKNSRNLIEQIESEKKYIEKKYQSLTNELSSPSMMKSRISDKSPDSSVISSSIVFQDIPSLTTIDRRDSNLTIFNFDTDQREKEILDLKKQIKDLIEENNYVRGLLAKEKKPSSKTQLKLQLFEVKKLANRLSEALVEKDMCIGNLKDINKELNKKNNQIEAEYQQLLRMRE